MTTRRQILKTIGLATVSAIASQNLEEEAKKKKPVLRFAHLTDMHIMPDSPSEEGVKKCINQILKSEKKVDFFINGGDIIMDSLSKTKEETEAQWAVWRRIKSTFPDLKFYHCLGNHDVWGQSPDKEKYQGKAWALREHNMDCPYYTFKSKGWNFIVLDSTQMKPDGKWYTAYIDKTQRSWLENTLKNIPANEPILVVSHIPIIGATPFLDGDNAKTGDWIVPGAWMHTDAKSLINLFYNHKNVKVAISGHIHLVETLIYHNVNYYCSGAVSGNWWEKEPYELTNKGYAIFELYEDGSHTFKYVEFEV